MIEGISAVTLGTHEMPRAVRFYRSLGFEVLHGGDESSFTSFRAGTSYLAGYQPATAPRDAEWGERFFHLTDPDGHELSFARPLLPISVQ
jgi:catechol 2,3-dioxygenase-like lactoylglutathione lyase family enzyme